MIYLYFWLCWLGVHNNDDNNNNNNNNNNFLFMYGLFDDGVSIHSLDCMLDYILYLVLCLSEQ